MAKGAGGETIALLVSWVATTVLSFLLVVADERFLLRRRPERLERAWPPSSRAAAVFVFGVLCLPVHFAKTRGGKGIRGIGGYALGTVMGVVAIYIVAVATALLVDGTLALFGLPAAGV